MKNKKYLIFLAALSITLQDAVVFAAEIPQELLTKKEITSLDWSLLQAKIDMTSNLAALQANFSTEKEWKFTPVLRAIGYSSEKKKIIAIYALLPLDTYFILTPTERQNQLEKIIEFTLMSVNLYFDPPLDKTNFDIIFTINSKAVAELNKGELKITEKQAS